MRNFTEVDQIRDPREINVTIAACSFARPGILVPVLEAIEAPAHARNLPVTFSYLWKHIPNPKLPSYVFDQNSRVYADRGVLGVRLCHPFYIAATETSPAAHSDLTECGHDLSVMEDARLLGDTTFDTMVVIGHFAKAPANAEEDVELLVDSAQDYDGKIIVLYDTGHPYLREQGRESWESGYREVFTKYGCAFTSINLSQWPSVELRQVLNVTGIVAGGMLEAYVARDPQATQWPVVDTQPALAHLAQCKRHFHPDFA